VDGVTWASYGEGLERKLVDLHDRIHQGAYWAQPSRRVYIPKLDGRERPLGIAALEDKIVQRAAGGSAERNLGGRFPGVQLRIPADQAFRSALADANETLSETRPA
jgi:hypothetical protein